MKKSTSNVIHVKLIGSQETVKNPSRNIQPIVKGVSTSTQNVMTPLKKGIDVNPSDDERLSLLINTVLSQDSRNTHKIDSPGIRVKRNESSLPELPSRRQEL